MGLRKCKESSRDDIYEEKDVLQYEDQDDLEMLLINFPFDETCQKCQA